MMRRIVCKRMTSDGEITIVMIDPVDMEESGHTSYSAGIKFFVEKVRVEFDDFDDSDEPIEVSFQPSVDILFPRKGLLTRYKPLSAEEQDIFWETLSKHLKMR